MKVSKEEAIARILLGLKNGSIRLVETTKVEDGSPAILMCITTVPPNVLVRPIAEMSLILDSADAGKLYEKPKTLNMNPSWEGKYGRPIGEAPPLSPKAGY